MTKKCLICEKEIKVDAIAAYNATVWTSSGNYGSAVYDPLDGRVFLEAIICDECVIRKKGLIEEVVVTQPSEIVERRSPDF